MGAKEVEGEVSIETSGKRPTPIQKKKATTVKEEPRAKATGRAYYFAHHFLPSENNAACAKLQAGVAVTR